MVEAGKFIQRVLKLVIGIASGLACIVFFAVQALARPESPLMLWFGAAFAVLAVVFLVSFMRDGSKKK